MRNLQSTRALSSREKVVRAATTLFAAKGFAGTSTRDIARKARVNETTVFRLFRNKQDLYLQVLDHKMGLKEMGLKESERLLPVLQSSDDPGKGFPSLAEHLEELFDPVFLRLLFYAALEKPELLRKRYRPGLVSFYEILGRQIRERIDSEILRDLEPILTGRALVGIWLLGALAWGAPAREHRAERPLVQPRVSAPEERGQVST